MDRSSWPLEAPGSLEVWWGGGGGGDILMEKIFLKIVFQNVFLQQLEEN